MKEPFDLRKSVLRAQLFRLSAMDHILSLNMHHIASDGWSMAILFRELASLYQDFPTTAHLRSPTYRFNTPILQSGNGAG